MIEISRGFSRSLIDKNVCLEQRFRGAVQVYSERGRDREMQKGLREEECE